MSWEGSWSKDLKELDRRAMKEFIAAILDDCISVEICTVNKATGQHTRHHLSDEQRAFLANAANAAAEVS